MNPDDKRKIDDPELNQDATYDKKAEEDFDDSDDFHKNDDTALDDETGAASAASRPYDRNDSPFKDATDPRNTDGQFDGNIAI